MSDIQRLAREIIDTDASPLACEAMARALRRAGYPDGATDRTTYYEIRRSYDGGRTWVWDRNRAGPAGPAFHQVEWYETLAEAKAKLKALQPYISGRVLAQIVEVWAGDVALWAEYDVGLAPTDDGPVRPYVIPVNVDTPFVLPEDAELSSDKRLFSRLRGV